MDDPQFLSRLQFGFTAIFHYIYPPLTIGLGVFLVVVEALWLKTRNPLHQQMARFWTRVFGLTFAMGVATGLVLEFEFGTNWATYSRFVGDVFGSALAAEGIFAFFLESGFLAVLLFGWDKVSPAVHFLSTLMVCLGAHFSAIWIVVANSWMQTPAGHRVVAGPSGPRAEIIDFWAMALGPSTLDRLAHVLLGAWMAGAFLVLSISAWYLLKGRHEAFARASIEIGLALALLASVLQLVTGHHGAQGVARNQPAKLAAFEGHYRTGSAPLYLFGWVDESAERVRLGVALPGMLSFMVHGDAGQPVTGLAEFPPEDRPPANAVFQSYHAMVGIGLGLIGLSLLSAALWWRGRLFARRPVLWLLVFAVLGPQLANPLGWVSAELGRQPWIVQGLMRTRDAVSPSLTAGEAWASLLMFVGIYALLFAAFVYLLDDKIRHGPEDVDHHEAILARQARA
jgi:cytochrome d ubiquinol oxidase subunit I